MFEIVEIEIDKVDVELSKHIDDYTSIGCFLFKNFTKTWLKFNKNINTLKETDIKTICVYTWFDTHSGNIKNLAFSQYEEYEKFLIFRKEFKSLSTNDCFVLSTFEIKHIIELMNWKLNVKWFWNKKIQDLKNSKFMKLKLKENYAESLTDEENLKELGYTENDIKNFSSEEIKDILNS